MTGRPFLAMGTPHVPAPVKLIAGLLAASDALLVDAVHALEDRFGSIDESSAAAAWDISSYYRDELGTAIRRQFISFTRLVAAEVLGDVKHATNEMEGTWRSATGRCVNIDPGYVAATKLVLASTKDAAHRVYLGRGIYAETTLQFVDGAFAPFAHTYRDYAAPDALRFFSAVRVRYLAQLRTWHATP